MAKASWAERSYKGFPRTIRRKVLSRAAGHCEQCGRPTDRLEIDHRTPHAEGGSDELSNAWALCDTPCHETKTNTEIARGRDRKRREREPEPHPGQRHA